MPLHLSLKRVQHEDPSISLEALLEACTSGQMIICEVALVKWRRSCRASFFCDLTFPQAKPLCHCPSAGEPRELSLKYAMKCRCTSRHKLRCLSSMMKLKSNRPCSRLGVETFSKPTCIALVTEARLLLGLFFGKEHLTSSKYPAAISSLASPKPLGHISRQSHASSCAAEEECGSLTHLHLPE